MKRGSPAMIRVFLVDDHEVVRRGLVDLLSSDPALEVITLDMRGHGASGIADTYDLAAMAATPRWAVLSLVLPGATLVRLPGVGHMPMLEQPEVIDAALADLISRSAEHLPTWRRA